MRIATDSATFIFDAVQLLFQGPVVKVASCELNMLK